MRHRTPMPTRQCGSGFACRRAWPAVLALLLVPALTLPAPSDKPGVESNLPPILIGVSNVQSGPSSFLGRRLLSGSMAYFRLVNESGGIHGRKIEVIVKDDRYEPDPAVQNTYELITKDKVFFLFDYVGTPTLTRVLPLLKYFEAEQIVNIAPFTGADPQRRPPYDRYVFNIRASYREETRALVDYLSARGYKKIGFFGQADSYGKSGEIGVSDALADHGLRLVASVAYRRNSPIETSMEEQVAILREHGADAVIAVGVYGPCSAFIRDARSAGWNVPIANVSFVGASSLLQALQKLQPQGKKDLAEDLLNSQVVPPPEDTRYPLVAEFLAHTDSEMANFAALEGWMNAAVVTEALKRAGANPSRARFIKAMESLSGWDPGLGVALQFSPTNHQGLHKVWLTRAEHGKWVTEGETWFHR